jgi:AraC-like DNA-binding protein
MTGMKKMNKPKTYHQTEKKSAIVEEPVAMYAPVNFVKVPAIAEFTYKRFQKIADKVPFTLKEWADMLHLSERTLQRYAKNNTAFEGIYVEELNEHEKLKELKLFIQDIKQNKIGKVTTSHMNLSKYIDNYYLRLNNYFCGYSQEYLDEQLKKFK